MLELGWVGFSIETWHSRAETLDSATGQCVYRSWAWLGNSNTIQRARERGRNWDGWVSVLRPGTAGRRPWTRLPVSVSTGAGPG